MGVTFGVWDQLDDNGVPVQQLYQERLEMVAAAEQAGFHTYLLSEHHGTPLSTGPWPALFLAAAAARTSRIRLGTLCFILPLYHPLALVEQVAMLDRLSGGRLDVGVSRGISPHELGFFGVDAADARSIFDESLAILRAGMTQDRVTFAGEHYRLDDVPIAIRPIQQPHPPLWYATASPETAPQIAHEGMRLVSGGPAAHARTVLDAYRAAWDPAAGEPVAGLSRHVLVCDGDDEALAVAREAHTTWFASMMHIWHERGDRSWDEMFSWETARTHDTFVLGSPQTVRERLADALAVSGAGHLNLVFSWGSLTHERQRRSLELFAAEVMPALAG